MTDRPFRVYEDNTVQHQLYSDMHENQSYNFALVKQLEYSHFGTRCEMTMKDALSMMDRFVDPSDPDLPDVVNSIHAYQTAERIRKKHPFDRELQLCGLIHDLGKILFAFGEPSWAVVGDTYPLGCAFQKSIVYYDTLQSNPDIDNPIYCTKFGVYREGCGISNLVMSFGHDEYLYMVLKQNRKTHKLSEKYWNIIRFHSFYPWHTGGDYHYFMDDTDHKTLADITEFNKHDLYSKEDSVEITDDTKAYYSDLLNEYFPKRLKW